VTIGRLTGRAVTTAGALAVVAVRPLARRVLALVLAEVDLTALVRDNVDLDALMTTVDLDALMSRVDVDAIAQRVDVEVLVARVLQTLDVPALIRDSTESVASEAVQSVRTRGSEADAAVGRTIDRLLRRRPLPVG